MLNNFGFKSAKIGVLKKEVKDELLQGIGNESENEAESIGDDIEVSGSKPIKLQIILV
jgi:hypothetical protein